MHCQSLATGKFESLTQLPCMEANLEFLNAITVPASSRQHHVRERLCCKGLKNIGRPQPWRAFHFLTLLTVQLASLTYLTSIVALVDRSDFPVPSMAVLGSNIWKDFIANNGEDWFIGSLLDVGVN
eukprot:s686_g2.t1